MLYIYYPYVCLLLVENIWSGTSLTTGVCRSKGHQDSVAPKNTRCIDLSLVTSGASNRIESHTYYWVPRVWSGVVYTCA